MLGFVHCLASCTCLRARIFACCLHALSKSSALSKMGRLWALTFTPVIVMTFEFCQRGATVDTPFLTDLKTQTSPIERLVMLHNVLVQKFQSRDREPCLRTSEPFSVPCLGLRTRLGFLCFFSRGEGEVP